MSGQSLEGLILKGIGGFYYVKTADAVLECRARGLFRKQGLTPLPGDRVTVEGTREGDYVISVIGRRDNYFIRPPVANVDRVFLVVSSLLPKPNYTVIDKQLVLCEMQRIRPVIVLSKGDLQRDDMSAQTYALAGYEVVDYRDDMEPSLCGIRDSLCGISVVVGNSGVGKSTLINLLFPELGLATASESKKLGRGRHTTRAVELFASQNGYIVDTPGFSDIDLLGPESPTKQELADCFPEFAPYVGNCYFTGCSHLTEKGCAVLKAVDEGAIARSRHDSYSMFYRELSAQKPWK